MTVEARTDILCCPIDGVGEYRAHVELWSNDPLSRMVIRCLPYALSSWYKNGPPRLVLPLEFPLHGLSSPEEVSAVVEEHARSLAGPNQKVVLHEPTAVYPDRFRNDYSI